MRVHNQDAHQPFLPPALGCCSAFTTARSG